MRLKNDELGLCHKDGCGSKAIWECEWRLRETPIKALTTVKVCDDHRADAEEYILNDDNRAQFVGVLMDNNYIKNFETALQCVKHNSVIDFFPLQNDNGAANDD
jgi:hypothetical protein